MARRGQGNWKDGSQWLRNFIAGLICVLRILANLSQQEHNRLRSLTPGAERMCFRINGPLPFVGNTDGDVTCYDIDTGLERETAPDHLLILENIDPEGRLNVPLAGQLPEEQAPDIDPLDPAARLDEAELALLLRLGEVVGLPRQIEREEANIVTRPQVPQPIAEDDSVPLISVPDVADGVPQNLLMPLAVQQALESADTPDDSASREFESTILQVQDEANSVNRPQMPRTSSSEGAMVPLDLVGGVAVRGSEHLPTVLQGPASVADDALEDDIDADDAAEDGIDADDAPSTEILADEDSKHAIIPVDATEPEGFAASASPPVSFGGDAPGPEILANEASGHAIIPVDATESEITGTDGLEPDVGAPDIGAAENSAIDTLDRPQEIERDEANTNLLEPTKVENEVGEPSEQLFLQMASGDGDRVATLSLSVPAGDLSSQLEVQRPSAVTKGGIAEAEATLPEEI